ncbi:MAG: hypothetical protein DKINENOH_05388 [bacterium]|nr:hypothetical protein [bacterium]
MDSYKKLLTSAAKTYWCFCIFLKGRKWFITRLTAFKMISGFMLVFFISACDLFTDFEPPTIKFLSPTQGEKHYVSVDIKVEAKDNKRVTRVELFYAGKELLATLSTEPYQYSWDFSSTINDGEHIIVAKAYDKAGNFSEAQVEFFGYRSLPQKPALLSPANSQTLSSTTFVFDWSDVAGAMYYMLQIDSDNGFTSPVIQDTSIAVSNYTPSKSFSEGSYYWRVSSKNLDNRWGEWSEIWKFIIDLSGAPSAPRLQNPTNGYITTNNKPTFGWSEVAGATNYHIQVDNDVAFASPEINVSDLSATAFAPEFSLLDGVYYWRVKAKNAVGGWGVWAAAWNLVIDSTSPIRPTLISPTNNSFIVDRTPDFDWGDITDIAKYQFQLDDDTTFLQVIFEEIDLTSSILYSYIYSSTSFADGKYFWRVRAQDRAENWGPWSAIWNFRVTSVDSTGPILISPLDDASISIGRPSFYWKLVSGAVGYQLQIGESSSFYSPIIDERPLTSIPFTLVITLAKGTYYWRVRAIDGFGADAKWSSVWKFITLADDSTVPRLLSPNDKSKLNDRTLTFTWKEIAGTFEYEIQVDDYSSFSSPIIDQGQLTSAMYAPINSLSDNTYYWRVRATSDTGIWSTWSNTWEFTIDTQGPYAPSLYSPTPGEVLNSLPTFDWGESTGASGYHIQIDDNVGFAKPEINDSSLVNSSYTPLSSLSDRTYYWRVRAKDDVQNWGNWSTSRNFVVDDIPPDAPILQSPKDSAAFWEEEKIVFRWSAQGGNTEYEVQIHGNSDFSSPTIKRNTSTNELTLASNSLSEMPYFWRVRAKDQVQWGEWTSPKEFEVLPYEVGSFSMPDYARGISIYNDHAFLATGLAGLWILDLSVPVRPVLVGFSDTPGTAYDVATSGSYAFVADGSAGLQILEISTPTHPKLISSLNTLGSAYGVTKSGDIVYVANGSSGIRMINIANPSSPKETSALDTPGEALSVAVSGSYLYVADKSSGMRVIDISTPSSPVEVNSYSTPGDASGVTVNGNLAYFAASSGLVIFDVTDPRSIRLLGFYGTGTAKNVFVNGSHAFLAIDSYYDGLTVLNVSNPSNPYREGAASAPSYANDVFVYRGYAFVAAGYKGLRVLKVKQ